MLGRLVLLLLQVAGGYFLGNMAMGHIPVPGNLSLFAYAVVVSIIVFLIGVIGAQVIKDVSMPSSATLSATLVLALIFALIWTFVPPLVPDIPWNKVPARWAVLMGAVLGYFAKR